MANKEKSAEKVNQMVGIFRCPLCHRPMEVVNLKSLICPNNHTFDFAKQGYLNMMTHPATSHYDKTLFEARQQIIMESGLYTLLHKKVSEVIQEHWDDSRASITLFDAGCGEGSHLQRILEECNQGAITGIGLDIAKEGVKIAAKNHVKPIWLVGDLASTPLADQSCQVMLNILSPANYREFKRILAPGGLVVKVVPRADYLQEMREGLFTDENKKSYSNEETVSLFQEHFQLVKHVRLNDIKKLNQAELSNLVHMSPLAWNAEKEQIDAFLNQDSLGITVDLDMLVGVRKSVTSGV